MELSRDINKIAVLTRAFSRSYRTASHCVVDVVRDVVLVGEVRVAPGPQAIFNRVVCHDYPRLARKARDINPNTENRPHDFDAREVLYESHASYLKTGTPQPQQNVIKSKVIKLPPSRSQSLLRATLVIAIGFFSCLSFFVDFPSQSAV